MIQYTVKSTTWKRLIWVNPLNFTKYVRVSYLLQTQTWANKTQVPVQLIKFSFYHCLSNVMLCTLEGEKK